MNSQTSLGIGPKDITSEFVQFNDVLVLNMREGDIPYVARFIDSKEYEAWLRKQKENFGQIGIAIFETRSKKFPSGMVNVILRPEDKTLAGLKEFTSL